MSVSVRAGLEGIVSFKWQPVYLQKGAAGSECSLDKRQSTGDSARLDRQTGESEDQSGSPDCRASGLKAGDLVSACMEKRASGSGFPTEHDFSGHKLLERFMSHVSRLESVLSRFPWQDCTATSYRNEPDG